MRDAICTVCGLVRTCKRPRNRDYMTETGDLKCAHCGRITRHAILESAAHAKMAQLRRERDDLILRGDDPAVYGREPWNLAERRAKYRLQQPQNPLLDHVWSVHSMAEARKNGTAAPIETVSVSCR